MQHFIKTAALLFCLFFFGCKDSSTNSGASGAMTGFVDAIDWQGKHVDKSGVTISIDGTPYSTLSDSKGRWDLKDVIPGTYSISFSKPGFATEKNIAYRFVGNGTDFLFSQNIYEMMNLHASLVIRPFANGNAVFSCKIYTNDPSESWMGITMLLFSKDSAVSPLAPNSYAYSMLSFGTGFNELHGYDFTVAASDLMAAGFASGDKIYCVGFATNISASVWDIQKQQSTLAASYYDIASGKEIYTGFGNSHSVAATFTLP